jgi:hypothetical protein
LKKGLKTAIQLSGSNLTDPDVLRPMGNKIPECEREKESIYTIDLEKRLYKKGYLGISSTVKLASCHEYRAR